MASTPIAELESLTRVEKSGLQCGESSVKASAEFQEDPRWLCVQRLIDTESFSKASRLSSFLLYIVERFLQERTEEITEQQIGVHVFGRPAHYNPGDDNIVRQTARQLRQRLALYYQEEGRSEQIQVIVPRGGYIPQFRYTAESAMATEVAAAEAPVEEITGLQLQGRAVNLLQEGRQHVGLRSAAFVGLGAVLGIALTLFSAAGRTLLQPRTETDRLWNALFTSNQRTIVVPGDAGVNMYSNLAKTQVSVSEYGSGTYRNKPDAQTPSGFSWYSFAARRYTTLSDLKFTSTLLQLPKVDKSRMEIRFARDLSFQDLQDSNVILIGSPIYDPWIQIFDRNQTFRMVYDGMENSISVLNRKPLQGEQATYKWSETDPQRTGYAIIALTDNLESTGKVLLVQGTAMGGVDAATDFLFHSEQMGPVIRDTIGKNGKLSNFELLLETSMYFGGSMKAKVIAERIHPSD